MVLPYWCFQSKPWVLYPKASSLTSGKRHETTSLHWTIAGSRVISSGCFDLPHGLDWTPSVASRFKANGAPVVWSLQRYSSLVQWVTDTYSIMLAKLVQPEVSHRHGLLSYHHWWANSWATTRTLFARLNCSWFSSTEIDYGKSPNWFSMKQAEVRKRYMERLRWIYHAIIVFINSINT